MGFVLKGNATATAKTTRTLEENVTVLILVKGGMKLDEAFLEVFGATIIPSMKATKDGGHPHSILGGFKTSVQKAVAAGDQVVIARLLEADLLDEVPDEDDEDDGDENEEFVEEFVDDDES